MGRGTQGVALSLGHLDEALGNAKQSVEIVGARRGIRSMEYGAVAQNLATIYSGLGQF
jgi:hypothetical protein